MSLPASLLIYLQKWQQVLLNGVDGRSVVVNTSRISHIVVKQTNSVWGTFSMFNIIETFRNYFTRKLLQDNLSSDVAVHFSVSYWRPYLVVSCSEEVFCRPVRPMYCYSTLSA